MNGLRIKVFKDGTQKLQWLVAKVGKDEVWKNIPVVFEKDDPKSDEDYRLEFDDFFRKEVFTGSKESYFKARLNGKTGRILE